MMYSIIFYMIYIISIIIVINGKVLNKLKWQNFNLLFQNNINHITYSKINYSYTIDLYFDNNIPDKIPTLEYAEYNYDVPAYTIIAHQHKKVIDLINEIKRNKINYVYIDAAVFTHNEIIELCNYYYLKTGKIIKNDPLYLYKDALVFLEDKEFIGGIFEMYQIIFRNRL